MATGPRPPRRSDELSGWAASGIVFAASMLLLIGAFQAVAGLVAIFDDEFYVVGRNYTFEFDTSAWGWIHLLIGLLVFATGIFLFQRRPWAAVAAIVIASLSAIVNFLFIPYYPFWSIVIIALDIWVIWAVTRRGAMER